MGHPTVDHAEPGSHFADGFDLPDRLAFGLTAGELGVVVCAAMAAYAVWHSALPVLLRLPVACVLSALGAALGWGRVQGQPLLALAALGARHAVGPRRGTMTFVDPRDAVPAPPRDPAPKADRAAAASGDSGPLARPPKQEPPKRDDPEPPWARWLRDGAGRPVSTGVFTGEPGPEPIELRPSEGDAAYPQASGEAHSLELADAPAATTAHPPRARLGRAGKASQAGRTDRRDSEGGGKQRDPALAKAGPGAAPPQDAAGGIVELTRRTPLVLLPGSLEPPRPQARGLELPQELELEGPIPVIAPLGRGLEPTTPARAVPVFVGATRRIAFHSLKGGTGKTTLATEVACLLAAEGRFRVAPGEPEQPLRVALVDLDVRAGSVAVHLGIPQPTIWDWLQGGADPDHLERSMVSHASGVRALLAPPKPLSTTNVAIGPTQLHSLVEQLEREGYQFIIFDVAPDLSEVTRWVLDAAHDINVVITPTASGVQDAYRSTEALRRLGLARKLSYVVNRDRPGIDLGEPMGDLGGRIVATVPYDAGVEHAENRHRRVTETTGPAASGIRALTATIYPAIGESPRRARWQRWVARVARFRVRRGR